MPMTQDCLTSMVNKSIYKMAKILWKKGVVFQNFQPQKYRKLHSYNMQIPIRYYRIFMKHTEHK